MNNYMIINADVMDGLSKLDDCSVQTCVTSPPYWGLRDYGVDGQLGLERTPEEYVARMVQVFREVRRVLRDDGTLWLNLGDSYARSGGWASNDGLGGCKRGESGRAKTNMQEGRNGQKCPPGLKEKDLVGIPWRVAFALQADGWFLRQDIIWHKPNPTPEGVRDRCTKAHEYIFLMSKQARYYYDNEAIAEKSDYPGRVCDMRNQNHKMAKADPVLMRRRPNRIIGRVIKTGDTRNRRSVWTVAVHPFSESHFATFPPKLIEPCILAGCPEGGLVLDPFCGSGTTGVVALRHGRRFVGIELNAEYVEMAHNRIQGDMPLFNAPGGHHIGDANEMVREG